MFASWKARRWTALVIGMSLAILGVACNGGGTPSGSTTAESTVIKIDGSSTVFPDH